MHHKLVLWLIAACFAVPSLASACELLPGAEQLEADRLELLKQEQIIRDLASQADLVSIAKVKNVSSNLDFAEFSVIKVINGKAAGSLKLSLDPTIRIGCYPSSFFLSSRVELGKTYLVYSKDGRMLRAGPNERGPNEISLQDELRLIRDQVRPKDSSD